MCNEFPLEAVSDIMTCIEDDHVWICDWTWSCSDSGLDAFWALTVHEAFLEDPNSTNQGTVSNSSELRLGAQGQICYTIPRDADVTDRDSARRQSVLIARHKCRAEDRRRR
jgi:hypothetical protein